MLSKTLESYAAMIRLALWIGLILAVVGAGWLLVRWDNGRLAERYNAGRNDERHLWEEGQKLATATATAAQLAATRTAEAAGDGARSGASQDASATAGEIQATVDTITRGHANAPPPTCTPADAPVALPGSVLDALDKARRRASGAARPATG